MAGKERDEGRPLDGFAARGFSAAYDEDRPRAEKELADTMAGPRDFYPQNGQDRGDDGAQSANDTAR